MNNFIARHVSVTNLGLITLKLDLLGNTVMALGRDGIRMAALRGERSRAGLMTFALVTIVGIFSSFTLLYCVKEAVILQHFSRFRSAVVLYLIAAILESLTESSTVELIFEQKFKKKIGIESTALIIKIGFILSSILCNVDKEEEELPLLLDSFSRGQLIYSITLNILHLIANSEFKKDQMVSLSFPSSKFYNLAMALTRQNFFKYFLSQGDLFIIGTFSSLNDQGIYSVVSNYGSLVLRLIMQPIEEASLQYFSKELSNGKRAADVTNYFNLMLKSLIYFGLFFVLGQKWTIDNTAANTLSAYCWLVAFAGISGFMESFVNAIIDEKEINWLRWISILSSIFYCILAIGLIHWKGSVGLVTAGAANFALRTFVNSNLIKKYHSRPQHPNFPIWILLSFLLAFIANCCLFYFKRNQSCL